MVLKLYGYTYSTHSKIVAVVLYEKGIPFEYINIDLAKGQHRTEEYLADDDGFILYESRAIPRYLEENYPNRGPKLIPSDPKKRALFEQAVASEAFNFDHYGTPIILETFVKKLQNQVPNEEKVKELSEALAAKLDVYEKILSKQKYIAGDELTLADIYYLPVGSLLPFAGFNVTEGRPNVKRWFDEISSLASWQKVKDGLSAPLAE